MAQEQMIAEILRVMYRLELIPYQDLDSCIDVLQLRLFNGQ